MVSKTKSDSDCVSVSHMVPRGRLTSYIGSMHDPMYKTALLFFLSHTILSSQEWVQQHTVGSATHAVSAVLSAVRCFMKMGPSEDRNIHQAENGVFFIIMWREQSDWCNKRNAERERSSSFSHFCVFFPTQVFLWWNLSTWGKLNSVHYWRKPSPACLLTMSRSNIIGCSCFWAKICIMTPSKKLMFLMSIWLTQEENLPNISMFKLLTKYFFAIFLRYGWN